MGKPGGSDWIAGGVVTYQKIPLIDLEWNHRSGTSPSTGYGRCLLSDLGGELPRPLRVDEIFELFNPAGSVAPDTNLKTYCGKQWIRQTAPPGGTTAVDVPYIVQNVKSKGVKLSDPWGTLKGDSRHHAHSVLSNKLQDGFRFDYIIWLSAKIVDGTEVDEDMDDSIVVLEFADIRLLWKMGGLVYGERNKIVDEGGVEGAHGKFYEWDPTVAKVSTFKPKNHKMGKWLANEDVAKPKKYSAMKGEDLDPTTNAETETVFTKAKLMEGYLGTDPSRAGGGGCLLDGKTIIGGPQGKDNKGFPGSQGYDGIVKTGPRAWSLGDLIGECLINLPGQPEVRFFSGGMAGRVPFNVNWGGGMSALTALDNLLKQFNLVLVPTFSGKFDADKPNNVAYNIYQQGEAAFSSVAGYKKPTDGFLKTFEVLPSGRGHLESVQNLFGPICVEVIGNRIVDEIACPSWVMVLQADGYQSAGSSTGSPAQNNAGASQGGGWAQTGSYGGLFMPGQWVRAEVLLKEWGYSMKEAMYSIMANKDKGRSAAFDNVPPEGDDEKSKTTREARKAILQKNFMKSFQVFGPWREFLPIKSVRTGPFWPAGGIPGSAVPLGIMVCSDGMTPASIRQLGEEGLYKNPSMVQLTEGDDYTIDNTHGVVSFKEARGVPIWRGGEFGFLDESVAQDYMLEEARRNFNDVLEEHAGKMQRIIDKNVYGLQPKAQPGVKGNHTYIDPMNQARKEITEFLKANTGYFKGGEIDPKHKDLFMDEMSWVMNEAAGGKNPDDYAMYKDQAAYSYAMDNFEAAQARLDKYIEGSVERINSSEMGMMEPRILMIYAWERDFGRQDDWFRVRVAKRTGANDGSGMHKAITGPAFPLVNNRLTQYVNFRGYSNKKALDMYANQVGLEFLGKSNLHGVTGEAYKWIGFWMIELSGQVPEVTYSYSLASGVLETETMVNQLLHGIKGGKPSGNWTNYVKTPR